MDNWISVEERLPEEGVPVWAYWAPYQTAEVVVYRGGTWWYSLDGSEALWVINKWETIDGDVDCYEELPTHWQPLPEPPEVQS